MECRKCKKEIQDGSAYCNYCGTKQEFVRSTKRRGNGQGCVYKTRRGDWKVEVTLGYDEVDGKIKRKRATKTGFATKKEALDFIPNLRKTTATTSEHIKFKDLYAKWASFHFDRITKDTINCYKAAYKYLIPIYYMDFSTIRTEHIQSCVDSCPCGKRTKENIRALCTSIFSYAIYQLNISEKNYAKGVYINSEKKGERKMFSSEQLQTMFRMADEVPELKYIIVMCYTGVRLGEMLSAKTENYNKDDGYFVTGSKTKAGRDRTITISPKILPYFSDFGKGEYLFFDGDKKVTEKRFRKDIFYPALEKAGIGVMSPDGSRMYTPHCCRHTFATLMKNVDAPATDKQRLIGHSNFEMTAHYTHTDVESLKRITDNL